MASQSLKEKTKAIINILQGKPVMVNITMLFFKGEETRIFDRLITKENKDAIIENCTFEKLKGLK